MSVGRCSSVDFDDFPRQCSRLTDAEAADGVSGKADFDSPLGGFLAQCAVHPTLHDAKEGLRRRALALSPRLPERHFVFVLLEILLASLRPAQRQFHGSPHPLPIRRILGAFVKRHDDVSAQADLRLHRTFRAEEMRRPIQMRTERHAFLGDFAQIIQAEHLEAARVGENRPRPRHEAMQSAQLADLLDSWPQVEVIGVSQKNLNAKFLENVLRNAFDRGQRSHRHEDRSFDFAVRRDQAAGAGGAGLSLDLELEGHCGDCSNA